MKTTITKSIVSFLLIIVLLINFFSFSSYAHEIYNSNDIVISNNFFFYEDYILEKNVLDIDDEKLFIDLKVYKDNTYEMFIRTLDSEPKVISGKYSYQDFYDKIVLVAISKDRGREIRGKQYKHQELGTTTVSISMDEVEFILSSLADLAEYVAASLDIPNPREIGVLSRMIARNLSSRKYDYIEIETTAYEVLLTHDDSYYTHCYHAIVRSYKNDKLKNTKKEYYQAIGG